MAKKIFCIGDSLTWGNPERGNSYPQGLQHLLDFRTPGQFRVENKGVPGALSGSLNPFLINAGLSGIHNFGNLLNAHRPDIIIAGFGANDMFQGVADETIKVHLTMMCQAAKNYNTKLLLLGMPNWRGGRERIEDNPVYVQVGNEQGIPVQRDGYRTCLTNPSFQYDNVHLNPGTQGYLGYSFHVLDSLIVNGWV